VGIDEREGPILGDNIPAGDIVSEMAVEFSLSTVFRPLVVEEARVHFNNNLGRARALYCYAMLYSVISMARNVKNTKRLSPFSHRALCAPCSPFSLLTL